MNLISLFIGAILTENIVLTKFLGICPFLGTSNKEKSAIGIGTCVTIVVTLASVITYLLYNFVLVPTNSAYLTTIIFILVIASLVQIIEIVLQKKNPKLHESLGIYLPLITTNCAVFGITLLNINLDYNILEVLVFSIGSSIGFTLVIYIFATIRERLETCDVPASFKGYPIALIVASIIACIFSRFV